MMPDTVHLTLLDPDIMTKPAFMDFVREVKHEFRKL